MSVSVCLAANTIDYPEGGGHLWVYLNWALGLRQLGCRVIWFEMIDPGLSERQQRQMVRSLKTRLAPYGFADAVALAGWDGSWLPSVSGLACMDAEEAATADLLLNMAYDVPAKIVDRFRRSALLDIDPGLLQMWMSAGTIDIARHDVYFTTGETVGRPEARFPDLGLPWQYTSPGVALSWWPAYRAAPEAPFTTVAHWYDESIEYGGHCHDNSKRDGFLPFFDLPRRTRQALELALDLAHDDADRSLLTSRGWVVRPAREVVSTPWDYQRYVRESRGEFSCAKPSCVLLQNAWISDRTLCYLASGKPAVVQHTGPSRVLPDAAGLFRFRDIDEAARHLEAVAADYDHECRLARDLAEEFFDARTVAHSVLARAWG